jgi:hypothetical protein
MTPEPERPEESGVEAEQPDLMQVEATRLLVNDAMPRLAAIGFDRRQALEWARAYIVDQGSGDVDSFVSWIERRQSGDD